MSLPTDAIFVVVSMGWLVSFSILLFLCAVGLVVSIVLDVLWMLRARKQESIYTSNSDLAQEETERVKVVRPIRVS